MKSELLVIFWSVIHCNGIPIDSSSLSPNFFGLVSELSNSRRLLSLPSCPSNSYLWANFTTSSTIANPNLYCGNLSCGVAATIPAGNNFGLYPPQLTPVLNSQAPLTNYYVSGACQYNTGGGWSGPYSDWGTGQYAWNFGFQLWSGNLPSFAYSSVAVTPGNAYALQFQTAK